MADRDYCIAALAGIWVFSPCCREKPALKILGVAPRADNLTLRVGVGEKGPGNILTGTWFRNKGGKRAENMNDNHQTSSHCCLNGEKKMNVIRKKNEDVQEGVKVGSDGAFRARCF